MKQFLLAVSIVGLLLYAGLVIQQETVSTQGKGLSGDYGTLQEVLEATGAELDEAIIAGSVPVLDPSVEDQVKAALGWTVSDAFKGERREIQTQERDGHYYVTVRWTLSGTVAASWASKPQHVYSSLAEVGESPSVTVQLEGRTSLASDVLLVNRALDTVNATGRQPWQGALSASVAARSSHLPDSPLGVNVQVAMREDQEGEGARVWVAWPALLQDY